MHRGRIVVDKNRRRSRTDLLPGQDRPSPLRHFHCIWAGRARRIRSSTTCGETMPIVSSPAYWSGTVEPSFTAAFPGSINHQHSTFPSRSGKPLDRNLGYAKGATGTEPIRLQRPDSTAESTAQWTAKSRELRSTRPTSTGVSVTKSSTLVSQPCSRLKARRWQYPYLPSASGIRNTSPTRGLRLRWDLRLIDGDSSTPSSRAYSRCLERYSLCERSRHGSRPEPDFKCLAATSIIGWRFTPRDFSRTPAAISSKVRPY